MSDAVCRVNRLHHDWSNGLSCRWCEATRTPAEAIVSGLASRRGGDEDSARVLLAAYQAEVRRQDAARLLAERAQHASRNVFCHGIEHAAGRLTEWADNGAEVAR